MSSQILFFPSPSWSGLPPQQPLTFGWLSEPAVGGDPKDHEGKGKESGMTLQIK